MPKMPLAKSRDLQRMRKLRQTKKGEPVKHYTDTPGEPRTWRPPDSLAATAADSALQLEQQTERAGQISILAEVVLATHRCAETMEQTNRELASLCDLVSSWLAPPKKGA
jgi:hypothetical protein